MFPFSRNSLFYNYKYYCWNVETRKFTEITLHSNRERMITMSEKFHILFDGLKLNISKLGNARERHQIIKIKH